MSKLDPPAPETIDTADEERTRLAELLARAEPLLYSDPVQSLVHAGEGLEIAERLNDELAVIRGLSLMGEANRRLGMYRVSEQQYRRAQQLSENLGARDGVANAMVGIGSVYKNLGEYRQSLEQYQAALLIYEELDHRHGVATVTGTIGNIHRRLGEYSQALLNLESALALHQELDNPREITAVTGSLGSVHFNLGDYSTALAQFQSALELARANGDRRGVAAWTARIGTVNLRLGNHALALEHLQAALELFEQFGDRDGIAGVTGEIGHLYAMENFEGHNPVRAEQMLRRALDLFVEGGLKPLASETHRSLAGLYRQQGKWEESQEHFEKHYGLKEEIQSHEAYKLVQQFEHRRQIVEMEKQRAIEHAEAEAARLRARLLETQLERKQQELASTAMHLARQVEMLGSFRNDLRDIMRKNTDPLVVIREFRQKVNELPSASIDWPKFEVEFQQTYPEFRTKLLQKCPSATKMEVKICSLLMLRLTTEDIGKLLSISTRSVEWHRANIRRKLELTREDDLYAILSTI